MRLLLIALLLLVGHASAQDKWGYAQQGDDWKGLCASGQKQSPVNIETSSVREVAKDKPCIFKRYGKLTRVEIKPSHGTLKVTPVKDDSEPMTISGGGLPGKYIFDHVHFHWPSEHLVDGERFLLEAHFVHYKSIYNGTGEALNDPEGLAVLGVLFSAGEAHATLSAIQRGAGEGKAAINLASLFPADLTRFYRYRGSLTTPPCSEAVIWTVFESTLQTTPLQVEGLRSTIPFEYQVYDNYRHPQPLNYRTVELWNTDAHSKGHRVRTGALFAGLIPLHYSHFGRTFY